MLVGGHKRGVGAHVRIYRRASLYGAAEVDQPLAAAQHDRLYDVPPGYQRTGGDCESELIEDVSEKHSSFDCLRNDRRRHEETLKNEAVLVVGEADVTAYSRRGQPVERCLHKAFFAGYITAGQGQSAAGVLDQRTGYQVDTEGSRFVALDKFAVAVVDEHSAARVCRAHGHGNHGYVLIG